MTFDRRWSCILGRNWDVLSYVLLEETDRLFLFLDWKRHKYSTAFNVLE